ncbi:MAG TPA: 3-deoxy-8-phosphooctulonate synthase [Terricaulis sp.]|nr:3-deoxy-8-phosphooctulonate synthase [Terricaulis sp.]
MSMPAPIIRIPRVESTPLEIGNHLPLTFICGPCQLESRGHALETAEFLRGLFARAGAGFIYKTSFDKANRSSLATKRGAGLAKSGPIFEEIRTKLGVPVITDVHLPDQCADVAEVVDVLQIPAFLSRQTAETGKPINVKKGQFLAPWDMKNVIAKITDSGNPNVMACERGASFGYNTLVSDMRAIPIMKTFGAPVVFDATHSVQQPGGRGDTSGGERQFVPMLARAAVSIGVAAVFIEAHPDPDNAPSDGPNMVPFDQLEGLVRDLMAFDHLAKTSLAAAE